MNEYVCTETLAPLRKGPSHKSEMGSQIILGERFTICDKAGSWTRIESIFDSYSGWVDNDHFSFCRYLNSGPSEILTKGIRAYREDGSETYLFCGSEIYEISTDRQHFRVGNDLYRCKHSVPVLPPAGDLPSTAGLFINAPYLWGGRTFCGIDCSGLTQLVLKLHGTFIPRDSFKQAEKGATINMLSDAIAGDLLFFDNSERVITHTGILFDPEHIIHASGKVRIDMLDHQGIFNKESNKYTHHLRLIKRFKL